MHSRMKTLVVALAVLCWSAQAVADVPGTMVIQGALTSTGGGAAADGNYVVDFSIYNVPIGGSAAAVRFRTWTPFCPTNSRNLGWML